MAIITIFKKVKNTAGEYVNEYLLKDYLEGTNRSTKLVRDRYLAIKNKIDTFNNEKPTSKFAALDEKSSALVIDLLKSIYEEINTKTAENRYDIVWICSLIHRIYTDLKKVNLRAADLFSQEAIRLMQAVYNRDGYPNCPLIAIPKGRLTSIDSPTKKERQFDSPLVNLIAKPDTEQLDQSHINTFARQNLQVSTWDAEPPKLEARSDERARQLNKTYQEIQSFYQEKRLKSNVLKNDTTSLSLPPREEEEDYAVQEEVPSQESGDIDTFKADLNAAITSYKNWVEDNSLKGKIKSLFATKDKAQEAIKSAENLKEKQRDYEPRLFSSLRHGAKGIEKAGNLQGKLANANSIEDMCGLLATLLQENTSLHNHSLNTYLLEVVVNYSARFKIEGTYNLRSHKDRALLRNAIIESAFPADKTPSV